MRRRFAILAAGGLVLAWGAPAEASPYTASLQVQFGTLPPFSDTASGSLAVTGMQAVASGFTLPASQFTNLGTDLPISPPITIATSPLPVKMTRFRFGQAPTFTRVRQATGSFGAGGTGTMGLSGVAQLFLYFSFFGKQSWIQPVPGTGAFGIPGGTAMTTTNPPPVLVSTLTITAYGKSRNATGWLGSPGWVPGTVAAISGAGVLTSMGGRTPTSVSTVTAMGQPWATTTTTTSMGSYQNVNRSISLVTPVQVGITANSLFGPSVSFSTAFGRFDITITDQVPLPEPGTILLLGLGIASLALIGRKRRD